MQTISGEAASTPQRGWWLLGVVVLALLSMGFYTVTEPARLDHNHLLDAADLAGYALCHRITERSFTIAGRQLPLCARCTGMYLGVALVFVVMALSGRSRWYDLPRWPLLLALIGMLGLMGLDGLNSYSHFFADAPHLYQPRNWLRLVTGMGAGLMMGTLLFPALAQTLWRQGVYRPVLTNWRELFGLVLLAGLVVLLVLSNQPAILYVMAIVSAAGVVLTLTCLNTIVLLLLTRRDARADHWWQVTVPLLFGLFFAVSEIAIISYARFALTGTMTGLPGL